MWLHLDIVQHHNFCNHCDQFHFDIDQLHIDDIDTFLCNIYLFYLSLRRTLSHHCKPLTFYIYQVRMFRKCTFRQDSNLYRMLYKIWQQSSLEKMRDSSTERFSSRLSPNGTPNEESKSARDLQTRSAFETARGIRVRTRRAQKSPFRGNPFTESPVQRRGCVRKGFLGHRGLEKPVLGHTGF